MAELPELDEITVPETEPETEWILGEAVQKASPRRTHAVLQAAIAAHLRAWARGRGIVGTERRCRIMPPGERPRPLVPDVAFLSNERKAGLTAELLDRLHERSIPGPHDRWSTHFCEARRVAATFP